MSVNNSLNLVYVNDSFKASLLDEDDVHIEKYIEGYNELSKFLNLLGSVFSFVNSDVRSKMKILEKHSRGDDSVHYESCRKMMRFEKESGLHEKKGFTSGSRTLLRLHRGLDFIRLFLKQLGESEELASTCSVCQEAYSATLAAFHPWYVRQSALLAMYTLPARQDLLQKVFGDKAMLENALRILPETLQTCDAVYQRVEMLYSDFDFHGLP